MKNAKQFLQERKTASGYGLRLQVFIKEYLTYRKMYDKPLKILDIGCGEDAELYKRKVKEDIYYGCDYYQTISSKADHYVQIDLDEEPLSSKFKGITFDVIFMHNTSDGSISFWF